MSKNNKKVTKLTDLEQMDGRLVEKETIPTTLDALFGGIGFGKYNTLDKNEYVQELDNFNTAELRNHAIKIGLIPIASVQRLKKQLLVEFDKFSLAAKNTTKPISKILSPEKQKIGLSILSAVK